MSRYPTNKPKFCLDELPVGTRLQLANGDVVVLYAKGSIHHMCRLLKPIGRAEFGGWNVDGSKRSNTGFDWPPNMDIVKVL